MDAGREDAEHHRDTDAAVGGLADPDEEAGGEQLLVVGRHRAEQGGDAPEHRHQDQRPHPAPTVGEQRQREGEQADHQGDDARERGQLGIGQGPFGFQEREDCAEHLAGHVVGQQQGEGEREHEPRVDPAAGRGSLGGGPGELGVDGGFGRLIGGGGQSHWGSWGGDWTEVGVMVRTSGIRGQCAARRSGDVRERRVPPRGWGRRGCRHGYPGR